MNKFAFAVRSRRAVTSAGLATLIALPGCGGESGCALAPGPCEGAFPTETLPQPTVEPSEITVAVGATATFTVNPNGLVAPTYRWYRAGPTAALAPVPGASGVTYSVVAAQRSDNGAAFSVFVESARGNGRIVQLSSAGTLHVTTVP